MKRVLFISLRALFSLLPTTPLHAAQLMVSSTFTDHAVFQRDIVQLANFARHGDSPASDPVITGEDGRFQPAQARLAVLFPHEVNRPANNQSSLNQAVVPQPTI